MLQQLLERFLLLLSVLRNGDWHYYEAHVTIEPVFDAREQDFRAICHQHGFRVAKLLMRKRARETAERSKDDSFCTGRGPSYAELKKRMFALCDDLQKAGLKVWRYKIESTLIDSRYDDREYLIGAHNK